MEWIIMIFVVVVLFTAFSLIKSGKVQSGVYQPLEELSTLPPGHEDALLLYPEYNGVYLMGYYDYDQEHWYRCVDITPISIVERCEDGRPKIILAKINNNVSF